MAPRVEEFYQRFADAIESVVDEEWNSAQLDAVFYSDGGTLTGEYIRKSDGKPVSMAVNGQMSDLFYDLRDRFRDEGARVWGRATFQINEQGKFSMQFGYDNCDANGDEIFDEDKAVQEAKERANRYFN